MKYLVSVYGNISTSEDYIIETDDEEFAEEEAISLFKEDFIKWYNEYPSEIELIDLTEVV